jgi:hypothetical protein
MGYVDSNLNPGEQVVYQTSLHWIIYLAPVVLAGFGATLAFSLPGLGLTLLGVGLHWGCHPGFGRSAANLPSPPPA